MQPILSEAVRNFFQRRFPSLVDAEAGGGLADKSLAEDGEDAALGLLGGGQAEGLEVGRARGVAGRRGAVERGNAENVHGAAERLLVQGAVAGHVGGGAVLQDGQGQVDGRGQGDSREESGGNGEELHFEM
jgi:hypothetical protein